MLKSPCVAAVCVSLLAGAAWSAPEGVKPIGDQASVMIPTGDDPAIGSVFLSKSRWIGADGLNIDLQFVSEDIEETGSSAMGSTASYQRFSLAKPDQLNGEERLCGGKARIMTAVIYDDRPNTVSVDFYDNPSFEQFGPAAQPCATFSFEQISTAASPRHDRALDDAYVAATTALEPEPVSANPGKWRKTIETNPMDDSKTVVLALSADEGRSRQGRPITLIARCKTNATELYINWNEYLGDDGSSPYSDFKYVQIRLGSQAAEMQEWGVSTDNEATFAPEWAGNLLQRMVREERMVVNTTPYNESPVTAIFDISNLEHPLRELADTCGWTFETIGK